MTKARRWNNSEWPKWLHIAWNMNAGEPGSLYCNDDLNDNEELFIGTLEGLYRVSWDDWIIQGMEGEIYPCKPAIFKMTYDPVIV